MTEQKYEITWLSSKVIKPNDYNPNKTDKRVYRSLVNSIREFGDVGRPIIVREVGKDKYVIIDGEHRFNALKELGQEEIPTIIIEADENKAKMLTIALNRLHGEMTEENMSLILQDLVTEYTPEQIGNLLAFDENDLNEILDFDVDAEIDDLEPFFEEKHEQRVGTKLNSVIGMVPQQPIESISQFDQYRGGFDEFNNLATENRTVPITFQVEVKDESVIHKAITKVRRELNITGTATALVTICEYFLKNYKKEEE